MNQLTNFKLSSTDGTTTMSSIDMVVYINASRPDGSAEVKHADFLKKVPRVLGESMCRKFFSHIQIAGPQGGTRSSPVYNFPKREACLMAMSYSYDLQAQIFDAWQEAEKALTKPLLPNFEDPIAAAEAWIASKRETQATTLQLAAVQVELEVAAPKVEFFDAVVADSRVYSLGDAAKLIGLGRTRFCNLLRQQGYVQPDLVPYAKSAKWIESAFAPQFVTTSGRVVPPTSYVTGAGLAYFSKRFANEVK